MIGLHTHGSKNSTWRKHCLDFCRQSSGGVQLSLCNCFTRCLEGAAELAERGQGGESLQCAPVWFVTNALDNPENTQRRITLHTGKRSSVRSPFISWGSFRCGRSKTGTVAFLWDCEVKNIVRVLSGFLWVYCVFYCSVVLAWFLSKYTISSRLYNLLHPRASPLSA